MKIFKKCINRLVKDQAGLVLPIALILLFLGGIMIPPLLDLSVDSLENNDLHFRKAQRIHSADAGTQHGIWMALNTKLEGSLAALNPANSGTNVYDPYKFDHNWIYTLSGTDQMNNRKMEVHVRNVWVLPDIIDGEDIIDLEAIQQAGDIMGFNVAPIDILQGLKLMVNGRVVTPGTPDADPTKSTPGTYEINILYRETQADYDYFGSLWYNGLPLERIGIWVPEGFRVDTSTCSLVKNETWFFDPMMGMMPDWTQYVREDILNPGSAGAAGAEIAWGGGSHQYIWTLEHPGGWPTCFNEFAAVGPSPMAMTKEVDITFDFYRTLESGTTTYVDFVPWVDTRYCPVDNPFIPPDLEPVPYSWDPRARIYDIGANSISSEGREGNVSAVTTVMRGITYTNLFENAITTSGNTTLNNGTCISGTVVYGAYTPQTNPDEHDICAEGSDCDTTCEPPINGGSEQFDQGTMDMPATWELEAYYLAMAPKENPPGEAGFTVAKDEWKTLVMGQDYVRGPIDFKPGGLRLTIKDDVYINGTLDISSHPAELDGSSYINGDILIGNAGELWIGGNSFIDGDLIVDNGGIIHLNGNTIFATGSILGGNGVFVYGPGCLVAIGDVNLDNSAANGKDDFIFIMSCDGDVTFHSSVTWYGSVAGSGDSVDIKAGGSIIHTDPPYDELDFPIGDMPDDTKKRVNIHTWNIGE